MIFPRKNIVAMVIIQYVEKFSGMKEYSLFSILNLRRIHLKIKIVSFQFVFAILSVMAAALLFGATAAFTYKAYIDLLDFIKIDYISSSNFLRRHFSYIVAFFVATATITQSFKVIFDKFNFWGKKMDNVIYAAFTGKKYFLDEAEVYLKRIKKIINIANREIQKYTWDYVIDLSCQKNKKVILDKVEKILQDDISDAIKKYSHVVNLLKFNDAEDNINMKRQEMIENELNDLIKQITDICKYLFDLKVRFLSS